MNIFISPHNDDETLFGAFTILRHKPKVIFVFDSQVQVLRGDSACKSNIRRAESLHALSILGVPSEDVYFCCISDASSPMPSVAYLADTIKLCVEDLIGVSVESVNKVFSPLFEESGHAQHNLVANAVEHVFGAQQITRYCTYTSSGKTESDHCVLVEENSDWVLRKLQALACYRSQINKWATRDHFLRSQYEYTV